MTLPPLLAKLSELIAFPAERPADPSRPNYERLAIPHTFRPQLSVTEAAIAAGGTMLRIFLGSLLFAFWGAGTWMTLAAINNIVLRYFVGLVSLVLFLILLTVLLIGISFLVRSIWPQNHRS